MTSIVQTRIKEHRELASQVYLLLENEIVAFAGLAIRCIRDGHTIFFCGNGGSAADAQHLAAEIIGRFYINRAAWPAIALTTDTSVLTAVANDFSYDEIFSRQIEGLGKRGDLLVGISTSGNSKNICLAFERANELGLITAGLLGHGGGFARDICQHKIIIPSKDTARIQEMHILIGHIVCEMIELELKSMGKPG